jgi:hypothetical protein
MILSFSELVFVCPVVRISMLILPVVGSVADCWRAFLINITASSTSLFSTYSDRRIFARDSEIRIMDSSYLGVAVTVLVVFPRARIFTYS